MIYFPQQIYFSQQPEAIVGKNCLWESPTNLFYLGLTSRARCISYIIVNPSTLVSGIRKVVVNTYSSPLYFVASTVFQSPIYKRKRGKAHQDAKANLD